MIQLYQALFYNPILNLLIIFYGLFVYLSIPGAFGFAIIALTLFIQFLTFPLLKKNREFTLKMQELKPHLDSISKKHKSNPQRMREEQARLYKEQGFNPAAGCLLPLIQFPVIIALFQVLIKLLENNGNGGVIAEINKVLYLPALKITEINPDFFGYNLALSPRDGGLWYYYLVPIVTVALSYLQFKISSAGMMSPKKDDDKKKDKKPSTQEDFQKAMSVQMKYIFPLLFGWISFTFPVGLALYWNTSSIFTIIQYRKLNTQSKVLSTKS